MPTVSLRLDGVRASCGMMSAPAPMWCCPRSWRSLPSVSMEVLASLVQHPQGRRPVTPSGPDIPKPVAVSLSTDLVASIAEEA